MYFGLYPIFICYFFYITRIFLVDLPCRPLVYMTCKMYIYIEHNTTTLLYFEYPKKKTGYKDDVNITRGDPLCISSFMRKIYLYIHIITGE